MFDQLLQVYRAAMACMVVFVICLGVTAALAEYVPLLIVVGCVLIVLRLVWAKTRRY